MGQRRYYKNWCYKDIISQDLIHDLLKFHIVPDMKFKANLQPSRKTKPCLDWIVYPFLLHELIR
jgi:hypothetical protein